MYFPKGWNNKQRDHTMAGNPYRETRKSGQTDNLFAHFIIIKLMNQSSS